jgi:hypothetical protein
MKKTRLATQKRTWTPIPIPTPRLGETAAVVGGNTEDWDEVGMVVGDGVVVEDSDVTIDVNLDVGVTIVKLDACTV